MLRRLSIPLCTVLTLWSAPGGATALESGPASCPLGGEPVTVHRLVSQNTLGGWDSDGARYSTQGQYRTFEVVTCPEHGLSLRGVDLAEGLTPDQVKAVDAVLPDKPLADGDPVWERYRQAADVYRALGRSRWELARLYLQGAWTVRDSAVGVIRGVEGPVVARLLIEAGRDAVQAAAPAQRRTLQFNLAKIAHRAGWTSERDTWLQALEAQPLDDAERAALRALRTAAVEEPRMQDLAIVELARLLQAGEGTTWERAQARYLLADLLRRRGRATEAGPLYDAVVGDADAPDEVRELARYLGAELRGERPWEARSATKLPLAPPGP